MSEVRSFTTSIIVLHPEEPKILCVRHPAFGIWMFPGGHIEDGEPPHVAALREVEEEVGLKVRLLDRSELPRWSDGRNKRLPQPFAMIEEALPGGGCYVDVVYVGLAGEADLLFAKEIYAADWFDAGELAALETSFPIKELAAQVFDRWSQLRP